MDHEKLKEQYRHEFDPASYLEMVKKDKWLYLFYQRQLHTIVSCDVLREGGSFLEFGCGPTPFNVFPFTRKWQAIVQCEYLEQNRRALQTWINNDADALDWSFLAESQARLEGYSDIKVGCCNIQERTRRAIKHVVPCDVYDMTVLPQEHRGVYDVLFTSLCFEGAAMDLDAYNTAVFNVTELVKRGGHIVQCGVLGCKAYTVGHAVFGTMSLTEDIVKTALRKVGFEILRWEVDEPKATENYESEYDSAFVVVAVKA